MERRTRFARIARRLRSRLRRTRRGAVHPGSRHPDAVGTARARVAEEHVRNHGGGHPGQFPVGGY